MSSSARPRVVGRLALLLAAGCVACGWAEQWGRRAAHQSVLKGHVSVCAAAHSAVARPWWTLPPDEADRVCRALLLTRGVAWPTTLQAGSLVAALGRVARESDSPLERALAIRRLGDLATMTPDPSGPRADGEGVRLTAQVLNSARNEDPDQGVRVAAAAAWIRLRPVARAYWLAESSAGR